MTVSRNDGHMLASETDSIIIQSLLMTVLYEEKQIRIP